MSIVKIASVGASSVAGAAVTTGAIDTSGANFIVLVTAGYEGINPFINITDNKGNSGNYINLSTITEAGSFAVRISYLENAIVGAGHTFTTGAALSFCALCVIAFSGVKTSSSFDATNSNTTLGSAATSLQTGSVTPSEDNEVLIAGAMLVDAGSTVDSIDGGFTLEVVQPYDSGNAQGGAIAYLIQTSLAAANPAFSFNISTRAAAQIATFKQASGGVVTPKRLAILGVG